MNAKLILAVLALIFLTTFSCSTTSKSREQLIENIPYKNKQSSVLTECSSKNNLYNIKLIKEDSLSDKVKLNILGPSLSDSALFSLKRMPIIINDLKNLSLICGDQSFKLEMNDRLGNYYSKTMYQFKLDSIKNNTMYNGTIEIHSSRQGIMVAILPNIEAIPFKDFPPKNILNSKYIQLLSPGNYENGISHYISSLNKLKLQNNKALNLATDESILKMLIDEFYISNDAESFEKLKKFLIEAGLFQKATFINSGIN
ncbi:hypothetical protein GCM10009117_14130 [Gangjinia marincola]|uniref:Uncharacterized protein n=1 Tax=Gangjinia marincola TaxID=578463 RepID=A0ABN1MHC3_9FLAO